MRGNRDTPGITGTPLSAHLIISVLFHLPIGSEHSVVLVCVVNTHWYFLEVWRCYAASGRFSEMSASQIRASVLQEGTGPLHEMGPLVIVYTQILRAKHGGFLKQSCDR